MGRIVFVVACVLAGVLAGGPAALATPTTPDPLDPAGWDPPHSPGDDHEAWLSSGGPLYVLVPTIGFVLLVAVGMRWAARAGRSV